MEVITNCQLSMANCLIQHPPSRGDVDEDVTLRGYGDALPCRRTVLEFTDSREQRLLNRPIYSSRYYSRVSHSPLSINGDFDDHVLLKMRRKLCGRDRRNLS